MTFAAVTKNIKICTAVVILNYSGKRKERKLIYFSERKNNQEVKAVHSLQSRRNAKEELCYKDTKHQIYQYKLQPHGKYFGGLSYTAVNIPNERAVSSGISEEILPRNCLKKKGL